METTYLLITVPINYAGWNFFNDINEYSHTNLSLCFLYPKDILLIKIKKKYQMKTWYIYFILDYFIEKKSDPNKIYLI